MVYAYNEVWTQQEVFDKVEELSGETLDRNYLTITLKLPAEDLLAQIVQLKKPGEEEPADPKVLPWFWALQYQYSWGIRGDNNPKNAEYLGYLSSKELYPDMEFTSFEKYLKDLLAGTARMPYV
ncbi:hypothetical protein ColLi_01498 [Colletotrichum liriopes]|uniref:Uncharacterized protein n=1 Tax=Colletotrichum liriopes TaxID=708192 RepID=A0AA37GDH8_9PEZI|nr:hypothetical protein ColLi_01498 [Colletotrichum liriopes]